MHICSWVYAHTHTIPGVFTNLYMWVSLMYDANIAHIGRSMNKGATLLRRWSTTTNVKTWVWVPSAHRKSWPWWCTPVTLALWLWQWRQWLPEVYELASPVKSISIRLSERHCLKKGGVQLRKILWDQTPISICTGTHVYVHLKWWTCIP